MMDERQRIEQMAAEGRITRAEADRLIQVLDDIDGVERDLDGVAQATAGGGAAAAQEAAWTPPPPEGARTPPPREGKRAGELPRLEVHLLAGDVKVRVDELATVPTATSKGAALELERIEHGYRLRGHTGDEQALVERLLNNVQKSDISITLPPGYGLHLEMKAGDIEIRGPVAALTGRLMAGDLDAKEVCGIDFSFSAGDIDLGLRLEEGEHRLRAVAGDIDLRMLPGSDVSLRGHLNIGDLSLPAGWPATKRGLGSSFEHALGSGRASFTVDLATGDLAIEADGA